MGWWLLAVCLCSVNLLPAHLQVLLFYRCNMDARDFRMPPGNQEVFIFFSLPKADNGFAIDRSHNLVWGLGFGMLPKASALPKPYRMNLYCAPCSHIEWKVEGLPEISFFNFVACLPENFIGWMQSLLTSERPDGVLAPRGWCDTEASCWWQVGAEPKLLSPKPCLMHRQPYRWSAKVFFKPTSFKLQLQFWAWKTLFCFLLHLPSWGSWQVVGLGLGFFFLFFWGFFHTSLETLQQEAKFSGDTQEVGPADGSLSWLMSFLKGNKKTQPIGQVFLIFRTVMGSSNSSLIQVLCLLVSDILSF